MIQKIKDEIHTGIVIFVWVSVLCIGCAGGNGTEVVTSDGEVQKVNTRNFFVEEGQLKVHKRSIVTNADGTITEVELSSSANIQIDGQDYALQAGTKVEVLHKADGSFQISEATVITETDELIYKRFGTIAILFGDYTPGSDGAFSVGTAEIDTPVLISIQGDPPIDEVYTIKAQTTVVFDEDEGRLIKASLRDPNDPDIEIAYRLVHSLDEEIQLFLKDYETNISDLDNQKNRLYNATNIGKGTLFANIVLNIQGQYIDASNNFTNRPFSVNYGDTSIVYIDEDALELLELSFDTRGDTRVTNKVVWGREYLFSDFIPTSSSTYDLAHGELYDIVEKLSSGGGDDRRTEPALRYFMRRGLVQYVTRRYFNLFGTQPIGVLNANGVTNLFVPLDKFISLSWGTGDNIASIKSITVGDTASNINIGSNNLHIVNATETRNIRFYENGNIEIASLSGPQDVVVNGQRLRFRHVEPGIVRYYQLPSDHAYHMNAHDYTIRFRSNGQVLTAALLTNTRMSVGNNTFVVLGDEIISFWANGVLKQCTLAADKTVMMGDRSITFKADTIINFYEDTEVVEAGTFDPISLDLTNGGTVVTVQFSTGVFSTNGHVVALKAIDSDPVHTPPTLYNDIVVLLYEDDGSIATWNHIINNNDVTTMLSHWDGKRYLRSDGTDYIPDLDDNLSWLNIESSLGNGTLTLKP